MTARQRMQRRASAGSPERRRVLRAARPSPNTFTARGRRRPDRARAIGTGRRTLSGCAHRRGSRRARHGLLVRGPVGSRSSPEDSLPELILCRDRHFNPTRKRKDMGLRVNTNVLSMTAQRNLSNVSAACGQLRPPVLGPAHRLRGGRRGRPRDLRAHARAGPLAPASRAATPGRRQPRADRRRRAGGGQQQPHAHARARHPGLERHAQHGRPHGRGQRSSRSSSRRSTGSPNRRRFNGVSLLDGSATGVDPGRHRGGRDDRSHVRGHETDYARHQHQHHDGGERVGGPEPDRAPAAIRRFFFCCAWTSRLARTDRGRDGVVLQEPVQHVHRTERLAARWRASCPATCSATSASGSNADSRAARTRCGRDWCHHSAPAPAAAASTSRTASIAAPCRGLGRGVHPGPPHTTGSRTRCFP